VSAAKASPVRDESAGALWWAGPTGRRLRQSGGRKRWGPDRGVTERSGPRVSDGGHAQARHRGHALTGRALQSVAQRGERGEKSAWETASGTQMSGSVTSPTQNKTPTVGRDQRRCGEGGARTLLELALLGKLIQRGSESNVDKVLT
jgi:hypothetical protein